MSMPVQAQLAREAAKMIKGTESVEQSSEPLPELPPEPKPEIYRHTGPVRVFPPGLLAQDKESPKSDPENSESVSQPVASAPTPMFPKPAPARHTIALGAAITPKVAPPAPPSQSAVTTATGKCSQCSCTTFKVCSDDH